MLYWCFVLESSRGVVPNRILLFLKPIHLYVSTFSLCLHLASLINPFLCLGYRLDLPFPSICEHFQLSLNHIFLLVGQIDLLAWLKINAIDSPLLEAESFPEAHWDFSIYCLKINIKQYSFPCRFMEMSVNLFSTLRVMRSSGVGSQVQSSSRVWEVSVLFFTFLVTGHHILKF